MVYYYQYFIFYILFQSFQVKEVSMMYRHKLILLKNTYLQEIHTLEQEITMLPTESFFICKNGSYSKWIQTLNGNQVTIPKKNRKLAEKLAYRKYALLRIHDLTQEIKSIDKYLKSPPLRNGKSSSLLKNPLYTELLSPYFQSLDQELSNWSKMTYEHNPHHPEYATLKSPSGHLVRSKSELLIDMALFQHQLPFRYECQLLLSGIAFYPDFTIRHPKSGKTFYWEHFGMMNNLNYSKKTFEKLQIYNNHNILPDFNLITTYETTNHPLNLDVIENKIEFFFS